MSGDYLNVFQRIKDVEDPILFWQLGEFVDPDKPEWIKGQFEIAADENIQEYRIEFQAVRGANEMGYIAIDDIDFLQTELCEFKPTEAKPIITTTPAPTTTPTTTPKPEHWLECTFQTSLCGWELSGAINEDVFYWNRTNGQEIEANELLGPIIDHNENKDGMFFYLDSTFFTKVFHG